MGRTPRTTGRRTNSKASASRDNKQTNKKKSKASAKSRKGTRPKKALGPYMYYCKLNRKSLQMQNPNLSFGDIGRVLGSQWCELEDKEKQKYIRKAQLDKGGNTKHMRRNVK